MYKLLGILLIVNALVATAWWVAGDYPHKSWVFAVCLAALFAGAFFIVQDRATEITIKGVGTIKSAVEQASTDAKAIAELRDRMQAQSATVDLVAQQATKAAKLAEELSAKTDAAEVRLKDVDAALASARQKLEQIDSITEFTRTVLAARNDGRAAFDRLEAWANDASFPMREEALAAYRTVLDEHAQPIYLSGFTVPWREGVDPSKMNFADLRRNYETASDWVKPALIEYTWKREDIPKKERMTFLAEIVASDRSLKAVEYAGRFLSEALDAKLKPLAVKPLLNSWEEKRASIQ